VCEFIDYGHSPEEVRRVVLAVEKESHES
jgi:hypothetical protein